MIKRLTIILILLFVVIGLSTLPRFGMSWDEAAQQHLGGVGLNLLTGKIHTPEYLRADLIYYGPFFEMLNQYFGHSLLGSFNISFVDAFHALVVLAAGLGLWFLFLLGRRLFSPTVGLLAVILLALNPRFFAHAHYNTKDIPLMTAMIMILYLLTVGFFDRRPGRILWAGIVLGLGMAIRMDIIIVLPIFFCSYFVAMSLRGVERRSNPGIASLSLAMTTRYILIFLASAAITSFIVWPTLWRQPQILVESFNYFRHHGWEGLVFYFGKTYTAARLPWHYSPLFLLMTTPVATLLFFLGGIILSVRGLIKNQNIFAYGLLLSWLFMRLILTLLPGAIRYDGIRHLLPIFPAMALLAAVALWTLLQKMPNNWWRTGLLAIFGLSLLIEFGGNYPYGDSYFNEAARLLVGPHLEKKFEVEYWGTTVREGVSWLNKNAKPQATICLPIADHLLQFYPLRADLAWQCTKDPDYLMFFPRWPYLPQNLDELYHYSNRAAAFVISRQGSDLLYIYALK